MSDPRSTPGGAGGDSPGDVRGADGPRHGIRANPRRFLLLVLQVAFVGALAGIERTLLPIIADSEFSTSSNTETLTFIVAFGLAKAPANFVAGRLTDRYGRRWVLIAGWLLALPVPVMIAFAPSWGWIIAANLLLGVQQGLCWSTAIFMKVDVSGRRRSGTAIGINECFGYAGIAVMTYATGVVAAGHSTEAAFLLGEVIALVALVTAFYLVDETVLIPRATGDAATRTPGMAPRTPGAFAAISQAGFVTKLGDSAAWGLLPIYFAAEGLEISSIAVLTAAYPASWAVLQPFTGALSDRVGRRLPSAAGMALQAVGLVIIGVSGAFGGWLAGVVVLGAGTALAYPVLIAAAGDTADLHASRIGNYRLWRDLGFVVGAPFVGQISDRFGTPPALAVLSGIALVSAVVVLRGLRARQPADEAAAPAGVT
jgi:MFS family permease